MPVSEYILDLLRIHGPEVTVFDNEYRRCFWIEVRRPRAWKMVQGPAILVQTLDAGLNVLQQLDFNLCLIPDSFNEQEDDVVTTHNTRRCFEDIVHGGNTCVRMK
jgi:hypothetical protein